MNNSGDHINAKYALSRKDSEYLASVTLMPSDMRLELLRRYRKKNGQDALLKLFVEFIGLANSVEHNVYKRIQSIAVEYLNMPTVDAERLNLPTILGALDGSGIAVDNPTKGMCGGCAFRRGSTANECLSTVLDALESVRNKDQRFMCHGKGFSDGKATRLCAGFSATIRDQRSRKVDRVA